MKIIEENNSKIKFTYNAAGIRLVLYISILAGSTALIQKINGQHGEVEFIALYGFILIPLCCLNYLAPKTTFELTDKFLDIKKKYLIRKKITRYESSNLERFSFWKSRSQSGCSLQVKLHNVDEEVILFSGTNTLNGLAGSDILTKLNQFLKKNR
jgi:hypothetical protein